MCADDARSTSERHQAPSPRRGRGRRPGVRLGRRAPSPRRAAPSLRHCGRAAGTRGSFAPRVGLHRGCPGPGSLPGLVACGRRHAGTGCHPCQSFGRRCPLPGGLLPCFSGHVAHDSMLCTLLARMWICFGDLFVLPSSALKKLPERPGNFSGSSVLRSGRTVQARPPDGSPRPDARSMSGLGPTPRPGHSVGPTSGYVGTYVA